MKDCPDGLLSQKVSKTMYYFTYRYLGSLEVCKALDIPELILNPLWTHILNQPRQVSLISVEVESPFSIPNIQKQ